RQFPNENQGLGRGPELQPCLSTMAEPRPLRPLLADDLTDRRTNALPVGPGDEPWSAPRPPPPVTPHRSGILAGERESEEPRRRGAGPRAPPARPRRRCRSAPSD